MWVLIFSAALIIFVLRSAPAYFHHLHVILRHPRVNKFLEYAICLITGELIYSLAFQDLVGDGTASYVTLLNITISTLFFTAMLTWYLKSFIKSFLGGIAVFMALYFVCV